MLFKHTFLLMRFAYIVFILLLVLITSGCQQTLEDLFSEGNSLYRQGKYDEAIKTYDEVIRLDPNLEEAWNNKGVALDDQGKYDEAIKAYDEAIRLDPNLEEAWNNKGNALEVVGKTTEANAAFVKAKELGYTG
jgi:tetratricopeptide (TPR) repeat protein